MLFRSRWDHFAVKNCITTSSVLVRRDVLEAAGRFDLELQGPEDYDLWLRVIAIAPIANLPLALTGYRLTQGSLSSQPHKMEAGILRILQKLDERNAWGERRILRRKAYSGFHFASAITRAVHEEYAIALRNMLWSFVWYPLPYRVSGNALLTSRAAASAIYLLRLLQSHRMGALAKPAFALKTPAAETADEGASPTP